MRRAPGVHKLLGPKDRNPQANLTTKPTTNNKTPPQMRKPAPAPSASSPKAPRLKPKQPQLSTATKTIDQSD